MAGIGNALNSLRRSQKNAGALVLNTPHDAAAARLQSLVASGEKGRLILQPLPTGGLEAKFDTGDWFGWATVAWEKLKNPFPHPLIRPKRAQAIPFQDQGRIAVLGDWGTGLYGAPPIATSVRNDPAGYALLLHLGDVYYSGTASEVRQRFLDGWPSLANTPSRALNSNHEMYSGGHAYFDLTLAKFGQEASYFAYQNSHWTMVGLDVAYRDHAIDNAQVDWLKQIIAQAGDRRIVLFSHHQLYSHFEEQGQKLLAHPGFRSILDSKRIFAWYWGHEHRCVLFETPDPQFGMLARCVGHGGMPQSRDATRGLPRAKEKIYERADWRRSAGKVRDGLTLPAAIVLEGPNPLIPGEEEKFTPHGYAVLAFDGPRLVEQVLDPSGSVIYEKKLAG
ncbi:metallophosphoesterase [Mesorhizobium sp. L2C089B000]|nr:metallophosphoesterase [Mesorhizobium sp. L2C089B000]